MIRVSHCVPGTGFPQRDRYTEACERAAAELFPEAQISIEIGYAKDSKGNLEASFLSMGGSGFTEGVEEFVESYLTAIAEEVRDSYATERIHFLTGYNVHRPQDSYTVSLPLGECREVMANAEANPGSFSYSLQSLELTYDKLTGEFAVQEFRDPKSLLRGNYKEMRLNLPPKARNRRDLEVALDGLNLNFVSYLTIDGSNSRLITDRFIRLLCDYLLSTELRGVKLRALSGDHCSQIAKRLQHMAGDSDQPFVVW